MQLVDADPYISTRDYGGNFKWSCLLRVTALVDKGLLS